jgi:hypothetical protein
MPDLSERFMETDAKSIDVDGRTVVQMYEREVTDLRPSTSSSCAPPAIASRA